MKKRVLIITSLIMALAISFVAFSYTMAELESVFVTRGEFDRWANVDGITTVVINDVGESKIEVMGMSQYLESVMEQKKLESINIEAGYQMYRRDILSREKLDDVKSKSSDVYESWSKRRASELAGNGAFSSLFGAAKPTIVPPEGKASPSDAS